MDQCNVCIVGGEWGGMYQTRNKTSMTKATENKLRDLFADDYTFYYAVRQKFYNVLSRLRKYNEMLDNILDIR